MKYFLGYKKGMTRIYVDDKAVPVTVVYLPDNIVCLADKGDSETKVRLGVGIKKKPDRSQSGLYPGLKNVPVSIWDVRLADGEEVKVGDKFTVENIKSGSLLKITGITKSKGFAGVMKRWGFSGGKRTHGQSDRQRAPGSIGAGTDPGRVHRGKKMGGRMGAKKKTFIDREVVGVGEDYILVRGPLQGNSGDLLKIEVTKSDES